MKVVLNIRSYRLGWVEISTWRRWAGLSYKSVTGDPPYLVQNECDSLLFDDQSILMKNHFMVTAKFVCNTLRVHLMFDDQFLPWIVQLYMS